MVLWINSTKGNNIWQQRNQIKAKRGEFLFEKETQENIPVTLSHNLIAEPDCLIAIADLTEIKKEFENDYTKLQTKSEKISNQEELISLYHQNMFVQHMKTKNSVQDHLSYLKNVQLQQLQMVKLKYIH